MLPQRWTSVLGLVIGAIVLATGCTTTRRGEGSVHEGAVSMIEGTPLTNLSPLIGTWEGIISGMDDAGSAWSIPIHWTTHAAFGNRYVRFEFTSTEPRPNGHYLEFEGLFTWNEGTNEVESVWMSPRLRVMEESRFLDGRMIFFETGTFDDTGKVLTLISKQKHNPDGKVLTVRSTFRLIDADRFTVLDEHLDDASGIWSAASMFELTRVK